jgi:hypothetical protein
LFSSHILLKNVESDGQHFSGLDRDLIGGICQTAEDFITKLNAADKEKINKYSLKIFNENFSDEAFKNGLSKFLNNCISALG